MSEMNAYNISKINWVNVEKKITEMRKISNDYR